MNRTQSCFSDAIRPNDRSCHGDTVSQRIPQVANMLKAAKVVCVQFKYDGQLDYGVLADPVYLLSDGAPVIPGVPSALQAELRSLLQRASGPQIPSMGQRRRGSWRVSVPVPHPRRDSEGSP